MECQNVNQHVLIKCGSRLDMDSIKNQMEVLTSALSAKKPIIIQANEVMRADTAGLQLLLSFILAASTQNIKCEWQEPSFALIHIANLLGIRELLGLPEE